MEDKSNPTKLCLRNISDQTNDDEIREICERFGEVKYFKRLDNKNTVFVEFANTDQAETAKSKIYKENKMGWRVDYALPKTGGAPREGVNTRLTKPYENRGTNGGWFKSKDNTEKGWEDAKQAEKQPQEEKVDKKEKIDNRPHTIETEPIKADEVKTIGPQSKEKQPSVFPITKEDEKLRDAINDDHCTFCETPATGKCERCGDKYCSVKCQIKDWKTHRLICYPMPRLLHQSNLSLSKSSILSGSNKPAECTNVITAQEVRRSLGKIDDVKQNDSDKGSSINSKEIKKTFESLRKSSVAMSTPKMNNSDTIDGSRLRNTNYEEKEPKAVNKDVLNTIASQGKNEIVQNVFNKNNGETAKSLVTSTSPSKVKLNAKYLTFFDIRNNSRVIMTYTRDCKSAFIRPANQSEDFLKFTLKLVKLAKEANYAEELPKRDDLVLAPFEGNYYRAIVLLSEEADNMVKVAFLDFGNVADISRDKIKIVNDDILLKPRFSKRVLLQGIKVGQKNQEIENFMQHLVNEEVELIIKFDDDTLKTGTLVELIDAATKESINGKINNLGATVEKIQEVKSASVTKADAAKIKELTAIVEKVQKVEVAPTIRPNETDAVVEPKVEAHTKTIATDRKLQGENVNVFVADNTQLNAGLMVCVDVKDKLLLSKNEMKLVECSKELESASPHTPISGELCLIYYADYEYWCRAECISVNEVEQTIVARQIDYFSTLTCKIGNVRKLSENLCFPIITSLCFIHGIGDKITQPAVQERLAEVIPMYAELHADSIKYDDDKGYSIATFTSILNDLKGKDLI